MGCTPYHLIIVSFNYEQVGGYPSASGKIRRSNHVYFSAHYTKSQTYTAPA